MAPGPRMHIGSELTSPASSREPQVWVCQVVTGEEAGPASSPRGQGQHSGESGLALSGGCAHTFTAVDTG